MAENNILSRELKLTFLFIILAEVASFFIYWLKFSFDFAPLFIIIASTIVFAASLIKLEYGLFAAMLELFIGSQGHLISVEIMSWRLSLRVCIFCAIFLAWFISCSWKKGFFNDFRKTLKQNKAFLWLGLPILWALLLGFWNSNEIRNILLDINGWLFFLYIFPFSAAISDKKKFSVIIQIFMAAIIAIALKSLFFLFMLSHPTGLTIDFYKWGRDTLWGEFSVLQNGWIRIFSQSQIFALLGLLILLNFIAPSGQRCFSRDKKNIAGASIAIFLTAVIIISLSRSFWLALIFSIALSVLFYMAREKFNIKWLMSGLGILLALFICGSALTLAVMKFPFPKPAPVEISKSLSERFNLSGSAVASRWSQLRPLLKKISEHPIIGSGWGTTITYDSQDPRILTRQNPTGRYTTYAFEWGYLDMILKFGAAGLLIYLFAIFSILKKCLIVWHSDDADYLNKNLTPGLIIALFCLMAVHFFTPYLNHPLGIGFLLILTAFVNMRHNEMQTTDLFVKS